MCFLIFKPFFGLLCWSQPQGASQARKTFGMTRTANVNALQRLIPLQSMKTLT